MDRIYHLPTRDWTASAAEIANGLTSLLRTETGSQRLRLVQGAALIEAAEQGGLFGHIRVGAGKTLISGLLPVVMRSVRPMLLVPAKLVKKTRREFQELYVHWKIPRTIRIESYSKLGHANHATLLDAYRPDLIVSDEAHKLKYVQKSAVARRVARYMHENPSCKFVSLSGTLTDGSILDYAHILWWSLRSRSPIPQSPETIKEWAERLDATAPLQNDFAPLYPSLGPCTDRTDARKKFQDRLSATPGVIITHDSFDEVPLSIETIKLDFPEDLEPHFERLRTFWETPDGWYLADKSFEVWHVARQMGLGFFYMFDPRPPNDWYEARKNWARSVRNFLSAAQVYDTAFQVEQLARGGNLPRKMLEYWQTWEEIAPTYTPNSVPVWLSNYAIEWVRDNIREPTLIWCEHIAFAERLAACTRWPYFGAKGETVGGLFVEGYEPKTPAIVSVESNKEGRNLQKWSRNLLVSPKNDAVSTEQILGRTHREGQTKPVTMQVLVTCEENVSSLGNVLNRARYVYETTGQAQKVLGATWI